mmetsp:Transcript_4692/g.8855  ORF Transcript_4692/g.8855 Transcript_4692/m.8855 type:complete len:103 (-) Transcript_4692:219-527(-)
MDTGPACSPWLQFCFLTGLFRVSVVDILRPGGFHRGSTPHHSARNGQAVQSATIPPPSFSAVFAVFVSDRLQPAAVPDVHMSRPGARGAIVPRVAHQMSILG